MFLRLVTSMGQRKNSESLWGIEPQTFRFVLWCFTTEPQRLFSEQGLLRSSNDMHTARMSNVDSVMFLTVMLYLYQWQSNGAQIQRSEVRFLMGTQNFFFVPRSWRNENTSFLILHRAQNLPSLLFCQELFCGKNPASRNFLLYCFYQGRGARHSRLC